MEEETTSAMPQEPPDRLLLVDDNKVSRDALERQLESENMIVEGVANGAHALERLAQPGIDLVLLDMTMPELDGIKVLREIREAHPASELPIIMLADHADSHGTVHALSLGANDFLTKPIAFPVAVARVRTQLALVRARRDLTAAERKIGELDDQLRKITDGAPANAAPPDPHIKTESSEAGGAEKRKHPRRRMFKGAKVSFNNESSVVNCVMRDLSESGAKLEFESYFDCPPLVRLHITGGPAYDCEVRWFVSNMMGVHFLKQIID